MIVKEISVDNFDDVLLSIKNFVISSDIKEKGILISIPAIYVPDNFLEIFQTDFKNIFITDVEEIKSLEKKFHKKFSEIEHTKIGPLIIQHISLLDSFPEKWVLINELNYDFTITKGYRITDDRDLFRLTRVSKIK